MVLNDIAHLRTGDKGDTSQISVIAYEEGDYELLAAEVTVERVLAHFAGLPIRRAIRYELPLRHP
jgi:hypothetical protein